MSWETRRGRRYYTRSRRQQGKIVRQYWGTSEQAQAAAHEDAAQRALRQSHQQERQEREGIEQQILALCQEAQGRMQAALIAAGYHLHARGEWRRRRHGK